MTDKNRLVIYNWLSALMPDVGRLSGIRAAMLRWAGVEVGGGCFISAGAKFKGRGRIAIGARADIKHNAFFVVSGGNEFFHGVRPHGRIRVSEK